MKLAEALILRADYRKRIEQLRHRIPRNAKVQEGDTPAEDPQALLAELERVAADLTKIIQRINRTNAATLLEPGVTMADALAERDTLQLRHDTYRSLAAFATVTQDRMTRSEVKFRSTVQVSEVQKIADDLARQHRELDSKIQAANWATELLD